MSMYVHALDLAVACRSNRLMARSGRDCGKLLGSRLYVGPDGTFGRTEFEFSPKRNQFIE
jgi:hypothetical protein